MYRINCFPSDNPKVERESKGVPLCGQCQGPCRGCVVLRHSSTRSKDLGIHACKTAPEGGQPAYKHMKGTNGCFIKTTTIVSRLVLMPPWNVVCYACLWRCLYIATLLARFYVSACIWLHWWLPSCRIYLFSFLYYLFQVHSREVNSGVDLLTAQLFTD